MSSTKDSINIIIKDLNSGIFSYAAHALERMNEREITAADIECLISEGLENYEYR